MDVERNLHESLLRSARRCGDAVALEEVSGETLSYRELSELADGVRDHLVALGVQPGDRVGLCLRKSADAVAAVHGVLRAGAVYVPVDSFAALRRGAVILSDCAVKAVVVEAHLRDSLGQLLEDLGQNPAWLVVQEVGAGRGLRGALGAHARERPTSPSQSQHVPPDAPAYILYTSGSTGRPKGVVISHAAAISFVRWSVTNFEPESEDRFSSHAPLHFDLSILDLFVPFVVGARVVLISEAAGKEPHGLARLIAEKRISVWYSVPSILCMLVELSSLSGNDYSALRAVLFAGEVFPVRPLRRLTEAWPHARYYNLYGPTETNVCCVYEVALPIPSDRTSPYPIGQLCPHFEGIIVGPEEQEVALGERGELCVSGVGLMMGYWGLPEQTKAAFLTRPGRYYRTGDVVGRLECGNLAFVGRRDRMVKRRGYRVELGEIESCLQEHPEVREVAAVSLTSNSEVRIHVALALKEQRRLSILALKQFCAQRLPLYMLPDDFSFHQELPRTSTAKVDYQALLATV